MSLENNPFFPKVMQSIDLLVADNRQKDKEARDEERYYNRVEESRAYNEDLAQRQKDDKEVEGLTQFIVDYQRNVKTGAESDPDLLKSVVDRRNELIKAGAGVSLLGVNAPEAPKPGKQATTTKAKDTMVLLSPEVAKHYGYGTDQPVTRETKRILEQAYRPKWKPSDGTGKDQNDPVLILGNLEKRAQTVFDKGVKGKGDDWATGIGSKLLAEYQKDIKDIRLRLASGEISKSEARMEAINLGSFEQFLAEHGEAGDEIDAQLNDLEKIMMEDIND